MISIKNKHAQELMATAGAYLAELFDLLRSLIIPGTSAHDIDAYIACYLSKKQLVSQTKGYGTYRHVSCISINDVLVHGVPHKEVLVPEHGVIKVDVCAAWKGYCADMARCFSIGMLSSETQRLLTTAQQALDAGIAQATPGRRLADISGAIEDIIRPQGFGIVVQFAGHGIGRRMHEDPEILNVRTKDKGPLLKEGMAFALEPMITAGSSELIIAPDGWTARTADGSMTAHVEDTVIITAHGPRIITRLQEA